MALLDKLPSGTYNSVKDTINKLQFDPRQRSPALLRFIIEVEEEKLPKGGSVTDQFEQHLALSKLAVYEVLNLSPDIYEAMSAAMEGSQFTMAGTIEDMIQTGKNIYSLKNDGAEIPKDQLNNLKILANFIYGSRP